MSFRGGELGFSRAGWRGVSRGLLLCGCGGFFLARALLAQLVLEEGATLRDVLLELFHHLLCARRALAEL